jgi:predicted RNA methylase
LNQLINKLKDNEQDFEFYPTTNEIISIVNKDIHKIRDQKNNLSILDIGAGNGNFFTVLESLQVKPVKEYDRIVEFKKYAIEKSKILIDSMPSDVFVIGTDFNRQTLIDKQVDIIFCNPPYSEFESWMIKILNEANCKYIYMVVPERWKKNKEINSIIEKRSIKATVIGNTDFVDSEYRQARAKVDIIRFGQGTIYYNRHELQSDPFELWFDSFFNIKTDNDNKKSDYEKGKEKIENIKNSVVKGKNLIETLEELYNKDFDNLLNNYKALEKLDPEIFQELEINLNGLKEALKLKIKGLKNLYWQELFDNLTSITEKLTKGSREKLLKKLTEHTSVDFTSENAYAIIIWAIKNANIYFDEQLIEVYRWMTSKENIHNYKSNENFIKDTWRYCRDHTHYILDYRLVFHGYNNFNGYEFEKHNGMNKTTHDNINDFLTVGKNLGFNITKRSHDFEWSAGKAVKIMVDSEIFVEIRAYLNGNIHCKFNQKFIKKLNIEAGRLNGWIKSPEQASEEMGIPIEEVQQLYNSNLQIAPKNFNLLRIE